MKKSSLNRQTVKSTFYKLINMLATLKGMHVDVHVILVAYHIGVIYLHRPRPVLANFFMALICCAHHQCGIHMHIVTRKIQANQALE
jgi:hypothetical protein